MKQRFSSLDIKVIAHELSQKLVSLRVSNIYDLSSRIFLFKLAKPNHREQLIVDSGFRCHLTSFARTTATKPSVFVQRLRKFLQTRRITAVFQVGTDRVLEFQFSDGQYRLFLEFYAEGNIILTGRDLNVIALLRVVEKGDTSEKLHLGDKYNLAQRANVNGIEPLTAERVKTGLQKYVDQQAARTREQEQSQKSKKNKKKVGDELRKALGLAVSEYPPLLVEHALLVHGISPTLSPEDVINDGATLNKLLDALSEAERISNAVVSEPLPKSYIFAKIKDASVSNQEEVPVYDGQESNLPHGIMFDEFHPFKPEQLNKTPNLALVGYASFNVCVDTFFSSIEGQKLEARLQDKEESARKKIEHARQDQEKRIGGLRATQELHVRKAQAIEANLERVEEAQDAINGLIGQGKDWVEIEKIIEFEQKRRNPVAECIKLPLNLKQNSATLFLGEWDDDEDDVDGVDEGDVTDSDPSESDSEDSAAETTAPKKDSKKPKPVVQDKRLAVEIDLALSSWSNARIYYDQKKVAASKEQKTVQAADIALKNAKQKIEADLNRSLKQEKDILRPTRQPLWFEKFIFFISSDGYLVLAGHDDMQDDILYKKHLKRGDIFVHADLDDVAVVIIKNNPSTPDAPIPPSTLSQAGNMCVCSSVAWEKKSVMSAWWAPAEKVSKIAPTGDVLKPGEFHIKGEKNFLPPAQLLLGFAIMWQISDESKKNHKRRGVIADDEDTPSNAVTPGAQEADGAAEDSGDKLEQPAFDSGDERSAGSSLDEDDAADATAEAPADDISLDEDFRAYHNPLHGAPAQPIDEAGEDRQIPILHQLSADAPAAAPLDPNFSPTLAPTNPDDASSSASPPPSPTAASTAASPGPSAHKPQPKRGHKFKARKQRTKYAEQSDSEREAAMALLGSRAGAERKAAADAAAQAQREESARHAAEKKRRAEQLARRNEEARAHALLNHSIDEDEEDEAVDLGAIVHAPAAGDTLLAALPVCAPWAALGKCKYKIKLQPGAMKRGRAVREMLGKWNADGRRKGALDEKSEDVERVWPRELELLAGLKEAEVVNLLPVGKVRVVGAGIGEGGKGGGGQGKKGAGGGGGGGRSGKGGGGGGGKKKK